MDVSDGSGPFYAGMYSMIEEPSDEMISGQQFEEGGNLYKVHRSAK